MIYSYRNKHTGATIKSTVKCEGKVWEQVSGAKAPVEMPEQAEEVVEPKKSKKARK